MRLIDHVRRFADVSAWERRIGRATGSPPRLRPRAATFRYPTARRINEMVRVVGAADYLEIGLHAGITFERVSAPKKWGVDPAPRFPVDRLPSDWTVYVGTSDEFFAAHPTLLFDIVFIDGWHDFSQVTRDLINALNRIREGGLILIDDVMPGSVEAATAQSELSSKGDQVPPGWAGDVFRLVYLLSLNDPSGDHYCTIDGEGPVQTLVFPSAGQLDLVDGFKEAMTLEWDPYWLTARPKWLKSVPSLEDALRSHQGR